MTHFARRPTTAKSNCILSYLTSQLYAFYRNLEKIIIHFIVIQIIVTIDTLSCNNLTLIAFSDTRDVEVNGKTIHIISALDWLLQLKL